MGISCWHFLVVFLVGHYSTNASLQLNSPTIYIMHISVLGKTVQTVVTVEGEGRGGEGKGG